MHRLLSIPVSPESITMVIIHVCTSPANRKVRGVCKDVDDETMRIEDTSIADVSNSEIMKETRRDMIAGKRSEHCVRCNKEDDSGFQSRRWVDMKRYWKEFDIDDAIQNTKEDGTINTSEYPLLDLDIRMDNTCNLKCRMCGPIRKSSMVYRMDENNRL